MAKKPLPLQPYQQMGVGMMSAMAQMTASIVRLLEEKKLVELDAFAAALEDGVKAAEREKLPGLPPNFPRYDILMMRMTAKVLRKKKKGWRPIVIQGGIEDTPPK
jgi:hypothetical protein